MRPINEKARGERGRRERKREREREKEREKENLEEIYI